MHFSDSQSHIWHRSSSTSWLQSCVCWPGLFLIQNVVRLPVPTRCQHIWDWIPGVQNPWNGGRAARIVPRQEARWCCEYTCLLRIRIHYIHALVHIHPPTGPESESESQAGSLPGRPSEFNFSDHFCHQNGRVEAFCFSLDSEPHRGILLCVHVSITWSWTKKPNDTLSIRMHACMYVCVCVCMCVCVYIYIYIYYVSCIPFACASMYVCMYICIHVCMCSGFSTTRLRTRMLICVCMHACMHVCMCFMRWMSYSRLRIRMSVCMCIYSYTSYICMYAFVHVCVQLHMYACIVYTYMRIHKCCSCKVVFF